MKGYSLHVGVGFVDKDKYVGNQRLNSAENDARRMHQIASEYGQYDHSALLLSSKPGKENASFENFKTVLLNLIDRANSDVEGAYLLITFSGHGARAYPKEESWKKSEFLCFYDRMALEHEIKAMLLNLCESVKCFIIIDACHGGGIEESNTVVRGFEKGKEHDLPDFLKEIKTSHSAIENLEEQSFGDKFLPQPLANQLIEKEQVKNVDYKTLIAITPEVQSFKYFRSNICFLTACSAQNKTKDGAHDSFSLFTSAIDSTWNNNKFCGNYNDLFQDLKRKFSPDDGPIISGANANFFLNTIPFYFNENSRDHNIYTND